MLPEKGRAALKCGTPDADNTAACFIDPHLDHLARCNDGTRPAFSLRPGSGSGVNNWIIWLQGGGHCADQVSCSRRAASAKLARLITSKGYTVSDGVGVLSSDPAINPMMYNANTVVVHYCSSDDWSGAYTPAAAFRPNDPTTWIFQGRRIALAAVNSLYELKQKFAKARMIILGGTSAGGEGVTVTANDILPILPPAPTVLLANDAGFALNIGQFDLAAPAPYVGSVVNDAFDQNFQKGLALWQGRGDAKCAASAVTPQDSVNCYNSALLIQGGYIPVPTFVAESQLDTAQLTDELCPAIYGACPAPVNPRSAEGQYAAAFGAQMASALIGPGAASGDVAGGIGSGTSANYAVASPDVYAHVILNDQTEFTTPFPAPGGPVTPQQIWDRWLQNPRGARQLQIGVGPGVGQH